MNLTVNMNTVIVYVYICHSKIGAKICRNSTSPYELFVPMHYEYDIPVMIITLYFNTYFTVNYYREPMRS